MKFALRLAMLSLLMCLPARAHEVQTGSMLICDTQKQAERVVELFDGNEQVAISTVNAEAKNPTACAMANVAYVRGAPIGTTRTMAHTFQIVEVLVVGVSTPAGLRAVSPGTFFTLVKVREFAV